MKKRFICAALAAAMAASSVTCPSASAWDENAYKRTEQQMLYTLAAKKGVYSADDIIIASYSEKGGLKYKKSSASKKYYKDGVLLKNKWIRINGRRFYLGDDGTKQTGWVLVKDNWYFVDAKKGMLTGTQTIDGRFYDLGKSGRWDGVYRYPDGSAVPDFPNTLMSELYFNESNKSEHGGIYYDSGIYVILSLGEKTEKLLDNLFPGVSGIRFEPCRYSLADLEKIQNKLTADPALKRKWYSVGIGKNIVDIDVDEKYFDEVKKYIDDNGYSDAVSVHIGTEIVLE